MSKPFHILIVENHADTAKYLQMYLAECGHRAEVAVTLQEGVAALSRNVYEVVFSDIGLPDGSGWDLLQLASPTYPLFAIAMSGYGTSADRERSRKAGFRSYLLKPFTLDDVDDVLLEIQPPPLLPLEA